MRRVQSYDIINVNILLILLCCIKYLVGLVRCMYNGRPARETHGGQRKARE